MTIKAYANASHQSAIHEIVVPAGRTFYCLKSGNLGWRENLTCPVGTTTIKFFVDSTFPDEIWSDAEIERGDFISYTTDDGRVSSFEVPATGGTGETGGGGGDFSPSNSPVFMGDPKAPTSDSADNDTSVATTGFVKAAIAAIPPPFATRYLDDKDEVRQLTKTVDEERRNFLAAGLVGGAAAAGTLVAGAAQAQQTPLPTSSRGGTGAPDGYLNVKDFGPVGTSDDTATIRAAAAAAKATFNGWSSKGLYFGPGVNYTVKQPIDFRGISNIQCEGWLDYGGPIDGPSFNFGMKGTTARMSFLGFNDTRGNWASRRWPLVRFTGGVSMHVEVGQCPNYVQVYAEQGDYVKSWMNDFFLGQTWRLELCGDLPTDASGNPILGGSSGFTGWVNGNKFYGGQFNILRIGGPWRDVVSVTRQGSNTRMVTAVPHGYSTGDVVVLDNGIQGLGRHGRVTKINVTTFDVPGSYIGANWRSMGQAGYAPNANLFYSPQIEGAPFQVHVFGQFNHILQSRSESAGGNNEIVFGDPWCFGNTYERNHSSHGNVPSAGEGHGLNVTDYSSKNAVGWVRLPKGWGQ